MSRETVDVTDDLVDEHMTTSRDPLSSCTTSLLLDEEKWAWDYLALKAFKIRNFYTYLLIYKNYFG